LLALTFFGWDLAAEPHFADESAYISQSFYADLLLDGERNDPAWLSYAGYDLPPLPKYIIGFALKAQGYRRPGPAAMIAWYQDTSRQFVSKEALVAARLPSVFFGTLGCLAAYALGCLAKDHRLGWASAVLLMVNPLYELHARRAMSDVYAESLILATAAVGLWGWKRIMGGSVRVLLWLGIGSVSGILGGLATLSKLNGALGELILVAWAVLAVVLPKISWDRKAAVLSATILSGLVSLATFAALDPMLFAQPTPPIHPSIEPIARLGFLARARVIADHRVNVSDRGMNLFPNDALPSIRDKVAAVIVQGFGRFGPIGPRGRTDSTVRFDSRQDRGAFVWLPLVGFGLIAACLSGLRQFRRGEPPTAWCVVIQASLASLVVTLFIPLAWDRYFLSIQPGFAVLAGFAIFSDIDWFQPARQSVAEDQA
jgi:4-amino-4-deoxy-L-arabinose transferase-like glycosyltransferase